MSGIVSQADDRKKSLHITMTGNTSVGLFINVTIDLK